MDYQKVPNKFSTPLELMVTTISKGLPNSFGSKREYANKKRKENIGYLRTKKDKFGHHIK